MHRRGFLYLITSAAAAMGLSRLAGAASAPRKGVPGVTYFAVEAKGGPTVPAGARVYLDGQDVTDQADQCDLEAGWVRLLDVAERYQDGRPKRFAIPARRRVVYGRVELLET